MDIELVDPRARRLGERIAKRRHDMRMTQVGLAEASTLSQGAISRIEQGSTTPSVATLQKLRHGLAIDDHEWLLWLDLLTGPNQAA